MLVREGQARTPAHDRALAAAMAFVAGALNAAGFEAVGLFSANMTGNVSMAADRFALGDALTGLSYVAIFATFVAGATMASLLVSTGKRKGIRLIHAMAVFAEAVGLLLLGALEMVGSDGVRRASLAFGLSFLLGFQNAIATRISGSRVRTTHVSGMATDVGVGIGALLDHLVNGDGLAEARHLRAGLQLHAGAIASFCVGGAIGVAAHRAFGAGLLFGASAALLALSLPYLLSSR